MKVLQFAHDEQGCFKEDLKQGDYSFFELTAEDIRSVTALEAKAMVDDGNRSVYAFSTLAMPFEYALYGIEFKHCLWPVTLRLGMTGCIHPNIELAKKLRLEGKRLLARETPEWFYEIMDGNSQKLKGWFQEHVCAMEEPTMIEKYGIDALPLKGKKTPFVDFLPSWFECELSKVEFVAKPVDKARSSELLEQERQLEMLSMKYGLPSEALKNYASRHSLAEVEKWMEMAHLYADATAVTFGEAFQNLSKLRSFDEAKRRVEEERKQAGYRQTAQRLQASNPIAAKTSLETLVRDISFLGEKAALEKYAHDAENWKAAEVLAEKIPQNSRSVELLYQEITTSSLEAVYAKYLPNKDKLNRWGAIVAAVVLIIVIILLCMIK